jgi:cytochrome c5
MSAQQQENHTGPAKTPKQVMWLSIAAFVVPVFVIIGLVTYVTSGPKPSAGANDPLAVAQRLQKVGSVELQLAVGDRPVRSGEEVFKAQCSTCHASGALGAPKFGDKAAWAARIKTGFDALLHSALKGKNNMPAQSGGEYSDYEVARALVYMANDAGASFKEPAAPKK